MRASTPAAHATAALLLKPGATQTERYQVVSVLSDHKTRKQSIARASLVSGDAHAGRDLAEYISSRRAHISQRDPHWAEVAQSPKIHGTNDTFVLSDHTGSCGRHTCALLQDISAVYAASHAQHIRNTTTPVLNRRYKQITKIKVFFYQSSKFTHNKQTWHVQGVMV
jgi:hypothetical protein